LQGSFSRLRPGPGCRGRFARSSPGRVAGSILQAQAQAGLQGPLCRFTPAKGCRPRCAGSDP
jgi:hypothetical protein